MEFLTKLLLKNKKKLNHIFRPLPDNFWLNWWPYSHRISLAKRYFYGSFWAILENFRPPGNSAERLVMGKETVKPRPRLERGEGDWETVLPPPAVSILLALHQRWARVVVRVPVTFGTREQKFGTGTRCRGLACRGELMANIGDWWGSEGFQSCRLSANSEIGTGELSGEWGVGIVGHNFR